MLKILIKNGNIITINKNKDILYNTDILIENGLIAQIGSNIITEADKIINASGKIILPGFIQTHVHLCQTLFRGLAEDRELLSWLREKIWPLEAAHNEESTYFSSLLGIGELISGGTTTVLDMGGVNHTHKIFEAISKSGIRAFCGKAMMDSGQDVPQEIQETTQKSIDESLMLYNRWQGSCNGRIKYAFAPRFILSCSDELFYQLKNMSDEYKIPIHTHAYENKNEGLEVVKLKGMREFEYFNKVGILNDRLLAAHCVWVDEKDVKLLKEKDAKVLHCPSSNFKLGSGTLNIAKLINNDISVSIGTDGAPCNNNLDMLQELRTTALLQSVLNKPGTITAHKYLELATIEGAKALGLENEIGSIELGKKADIIIMDLNNDIHCWHPDEVDLPTRVVYTAKSSNVKTVIIDGEIILKNDKFKTLNKEEILDSCKAQSAKLLQKIKNIGY